MRIRVQERHATKALLDAIESLYQEHGSPEEFAKHFNDVYYLDDAAWAYLEDDAILADVQDFWDNHREPEEVASVTEVPGFIHPDDWLAERTDDDGKLLPAEGITSLDDLIKAYRTDILGY